jgi:DNA polymerase epsilon subunit 3
MPRKDAYGGSISAQAQQDLVSEGIENFELPKSLVMRIAKSAVRLARSQASSVVFTATRSQTM